MVGIWRWYRHDDCSVHAPITPDIVVAQHFPVRRFRPGYDAHEVDAYLDAVASSLAGYGPLVSPEEIRSHEFQKHHTRGGIDPGDVDDFLECIARTLEGRTGPPQAVIEY